MWKHSLKKNILTIATIISAVSGIILGIILRQTRHEKFTTRQIMYINFIGEIFLRMLKALILPLILASLISAIGRLDFSITKKLGFRAVVYYISTTIIAVAVGIFLVTIIKPGNFGGPIHNDNNNNLGNIKNNVVAGDAVFDLLRNMIPTNLIEACTHHYQTFLSPDKMLDIHQWAIDVKTVEGMNILGLVTFAFIFGTAISYLKAEANWTIIVIQEINEIIMKITNWVICLSPIGIFFLIVAKIVEPDDLHQLGGKLAFYFLTVCIGFIIHGFIILPLLYFLFTKKNPYIFIKNMGPALLVAFGTASSSVTIPVTIKQLEQKCRIDRVITRFIIPIGSTINMDGTALYEAVAAIFIAQSRDIDLSLADIIVISITATAASICAAGIPQAGLVTMIMVLNAVGLPAEDVSLIIAVDWILDRFRTVINVLGDSIGAGIIAAFYKKRNRIFYVTGYADMGQLRGGRMLP